MMRKLLYKKAKANCVLLLINFFLVGDATAQSHVEIVKNTPCLSEYRSWEFGADPWNKRYNSQFSPPLNFTKGECENAAKVSLKIQGEQAAYRSLMNDYATPSDDDEGRTECLREYRYWLKDFSKSQSFDDALASFAGFRIYDRESCVAARQANEQIATHNAAQNAALKARAKRASEITAKADAVRRAQREEFSRRPNVHIGMTADDVVERSNWGRPQSKNRTTTVHGVKEQWVYGDRRYLYFDNGVLTAIQD